MIRLHHVAQARSFRILWLMEEMGLDFEVARRSFFDKSLRSPEYLAISPAGRVPAVEIDGRVIYESGAITEYLCATRAMFGRAPGDADWVDWLEWLHFAETIGQHLANLTQQHIALREDWMRSPTVMRLEAKRLEKALQVVEAGLGADDWLLASGFSAVDCAVGYGALIGRRFVGFEGLPRVAGWLHRCEERPAFRRALARDGEADIYRRDFYPAPEG
jgi:glutathione S-transferase